MIYLQNDGGWSIQCESRLPLQGSCLTLEAGFSLQTGALFTNVVRAGGNGVPGRGEFAGGADVFSKPELRTLQCGALRPRRALEKSGSPCRRWKEQGTGQSKTSVNIPRTGD
jgi:hypothetical protein